MDGFLTLYISSPLSQGRELKSAREPEQETERVVAPLAGAGIEISYISRPFLRMLSPLSQGRELKSPGPSFPRYSVQVAPLAGAGIEMLLLAASM